MWQILSSISAFGAFLVAAIGMYLILRQLYALRSQVGSSATASLYGQMIEMDRYFASNPDLKPYFYGCQTIPENHDRYGTVRSLAEMMADLIEHTYVQKDCLPSDVLPQWFEYFTDIYNDSPILRVHMAQDKSKKWYAQEILRMIEEVNMRRKHQGVNKALEATSEKLKVVELPAISQE